MRIAMVCPYFLPVVGGMENYIYSLSKELAKKGNKVTVITCDRNRDNSEIKVKHEFIDGIEVRRVKNLFRLGPNTNVFPSLTKELANFDIINIHNYGHPHHFFSIKAAKSYKIPVVLTGHAPNEVTLTRSKTNSIVSKARDFFFSKYLLKNVSHIIAVMPSEVDWLLNHGAEKEKITFIPIGVDEMFFKKSDKLDFIKKYKLKNKKIILSVGRIEKRKGYGFLADSAKKVIDVIPNAVFVIAGPDFGYKTELLSKIKKLGLEKNFIFTGAIAMKEMPGVYSSADIFVMPSVHEGGPLTVPEAMIKGIPVISTRTGTVEYYLQSGKLGDIIDYGNTEKLSKLIIEKLNRKDKSKLAKARKFIEQLRWSNLSEKYLNVYRKVIKL